MNKAMINNWNSVVKPEDNIYHLGDVGFLDEGPLYNILSQLNGRKHLIWGNHDQTIKKSEKIRSLFVWCKDYHEFKKDGHTICLFHYPIGEWNKAHRGAYHLHGHCHGNYKYPREGRCMDVGANLINHTPIEFDEVIRRLVNKPLLQHH